MLSVIVVGAAVLCGLWLLVKLLAVIGICCLTDERFAWLVLFVLLVAGGVAAIRHVEGLRDEEKAAVAFLSAWRDEPPGPMGMDDVAVARHIDRDRLPGLPEGFSRRLRLLSMGPVRQVGEENVYYDCRKDDRFETLTVGEKATGLSAVRAKVFATDARFLAVEEGAAFPAEVRVWVAEDDGRVADLSIGGVAAGATLMGARDRNAERLRALRGGREY